MLLEFKKWKELSLSSKIILVIDILLSIIIIVLCFLHLFRVWEGALNIVEPLMGLFMILQAVKFWKTQRGAAIFSLIIGILIWILSILTFLEK